MGTGHLTDFGHSAKGWGQVQITWIEHMGRAFGQSTWAGPHGQSICTWNADSAGSRGSIEHIGGSCGQSTWAEHMDRAHGVQAA